MDGHFKEHRFSIDDQGRDVPCRLMLPGQASAVHTICILPQFSENELDENELLADLAVKILQRGAAVLCFPSRWRDLDAQSAAIRAGCDTFVETDGRIKAVVDECLGDRFAADCRAVLIGVSRFGFASLHAMADNEQISAAAAILPVTYWPKLVEFVGLEENTLIRQHDLQPLACLIAPRHVLFQVAAEDERVGTEHTLRLAEVFETAYHRQDADGRFVLQKYASQGHVLRREMIEGVVTWLEQTGLVGQL